MFNISRAVNKFWVSDSNETKGPVLFESVSYPSYSIGFWRLRNVNVLHNIEYIITVISGHKLGSLVSIIVFIGFNLLCFIALAVLYIQIFYLARSSSQSVQSSAQNKEIKMALKMSAIVLTDFFCWIPLAIVCVLVQCSAITVGPDMYAWIVGLILPINSAINPFLYTLASLIAEKL